MRIFSKNSKWWLVADVTFNAYKIAASTSTQNFLFTMLTSYRPLEFSVKKDINHFLLVSFSILDFWHLLKAMA